MTDRVRVVTVDRVDGIVTVERVTLLTVTLLTVTLLTELTELLLLIELSLLTELTPVLDCLMKMLIVCRFAELTTAIFL